MILFLIACFVLIIGYFTYGVFVEKIFGITKRKTPAMVHNDGVDYIPMPTYKAFLIQFLNIAGLGPVFGALLGAIYGPVCLLWIVFGCIFAGAVHDYLSGMLSLRNDGKSLTFLMEKYFGTHFRLVFVFILTAMLMLVGAIFAKSPAQMLAGMTQMPIWIWLVIIFGYYFLATLLPIDKIIGRFYPLFALCLLVSSVLLVCVLFTRDVPAFLNFDLQNHHPSGLPIFPLMFITIACGAISGFHATQSPMIARCVKDEKYARPIFYGAMITEGIIALMWATLGICFYESQNALALAVASTGTAGVVADISKGLLGSWGSVLIIISVVILSITTGDTCFRSARLSCADFLKMRQDKLSYRLGLTTFVLAGGVLLSIINVETIWQYFGWFNQTLAVCTLWLVTIYLKQANKLYWISFFPAVFMTAVCATYLFYDKLCFNLPIELSRYLGIATAALSALLFLFTSRSKKKKKRFTFRG